MKRKLLFSLLVLLLGMATAAAQEAAISDLQKRAETELKEGKTAGARSLYIRAYEDYASKGQMRQSVACGVKAVALYYKENAYHEAFELLRFIDQTIIGDKSGTNKSSLHYYTAKERMQMYVKLRKSAEAKNQLAIMENHANNSGDEEIKNDLLYNKAIYHYTFGQTAQGNAVFKEMAQKLTASKEYDKIDEVYKTLISSARSSNNASMVAQTYSSYIVWKDSVAELKRLDETGALKKQIADNEATIADKDSSLTARQAVIVGLAVLAAALAAVLVFGALVLLRYMALSRKQKKTIKLANETNALKAKFISNISAQLEPTLKKLDSRQPEVKALQDFSQHIQTLSSIENTMDEPVETEDTPLQPFCEKLMDAVRGREKRDVTLTVNAPKMSAKINKEYVGHILNHLLENAVEYTPEEGNVWLEYKKRGARTHQFVVSNTGERIPEERREDVFKPFLEIHDLTKGDGLGLPICKQMALKMGGDLDIDPQFVKGMRFVLELHA